MKPVRPLLFALGLALLSPLPAAALAPEPASTDEFVMTSAGFLSYHPDLRFRLLGLAEYRKGNYVEAMVQFRRAARYADKPSQGMIAEMLWKGQGTAVDRPAAYVWMDLAAERAYKMMLVQREKYWAEMTEAEREKRAGDRRRPARRIRRQRRPPAPGPEAAPGQAQGHRQPHRLRRQPQDFHPGPERFAQHRRLRLLRPEVLEHQRIPAHAGRRLEGIRRRHGGDRRAAVHGDLTVPTDASEEAEPEAGAAGKDDSPR